jgi:hypothetical protein
LPTQGRVVLQPRAVLCNPVGILNAKLCDDCGIVSWLVGGGMSRKGHLIVARYFSGGNLIATPFMRPVGTLEYATYHPIIQASLQDDYRR